MIDISQKPESFYFVQFTTVSSHYAGFIILISAVETGEKTKIQQLDLAQ